MVTPRPDAGQRRDAPRAPTPQTHRNAQECTYIYIDIDVCITIYEEGHCKGKGRREEEMKRGGGRRGIYVNRPSNLKRPRYYVDINQMRLCDQRYTNRFSYFIEIDLRFF